jgi:hypothetical protein
MRIWGNRVVRKRSISAEVCFLLDEHKTVQSLPIYLFSFSEFVSHYVFPQTCPSFQFFPLKGVRYLILTDKILPPNDFSLFVMSA